MNKKLAIVGHPTRGNEVIEILEMMGGVNSKNFSGKCDFFYFFIDNDNIISSDSNFNNNFTYFTLEKFLKENPFKVGDKAVYEDDNDIVVISEIKWDDTIGDIFYIVKRLDEDDYFLCPPELLKPYKETNMNEDNYQETSETKVLGYKVDDIIFTNDTGWIRITNKLWDCYAKEHVYEGIGILNGHEYKDIRHHNVTGKMQLGQLKYCKVVDDDDARHVNNITDDIMINQITNKVSVIKLKPDVCDDKIELQLGDYEVIVRDDKTYAVLKKPKYPKTYKECCERVNACPTVGISYDSDEDMLYNDEVDLTCLTLRKLFICRNAYWKIAGEEMGLDKPWEPDYTDLNNITYYGLYNKLRYSIINPAQFIFPTIEMRDAFYKNFKNLIENCK